jgi:uncharacterized membrane protein
VGAGNPIKQESIHKEAVVEAIRKAELHTSGEIRVHLCKNRNENDPIAAAQRIFHELKMDQTQERNGILLYVNLKLHAFAFWGDQAIHAKVGQSFWDHLRDTTQASIRHDNLTDGLCQAVTAMGVALGQHFPRAHGDQNELSNQVTETDPDRE